MKKILFVCTGNTCRSVMAEWFFNKAVGLSGTGDYGYADRKVFIADSAGISAYDGEPPSRSTLKILKNRLGLEAGEITTRSKSLSGSLVNGSHLILTMTRQQRDHIRMTFPQAKDKTFIFKEYISYMDGKADIAGKADICDPFGRSDPDYTACADEIKAAVDRLIQCMRRNV